MRGLREGGRGERVPKSDRSIPIRHFRHWFLFSPAGVAGTIGRGRLMDPTGVHETQRCDRQIMTPVP